MQSGVAFKGDQCDLADIYNPPTPLLARNRYFTRDPLTFMCGAANATYAEWQGKGQDSESKVFPEPHRDAVMQWAREMLRGGGREALHVVRG